MTSDRNNPDELRVIDRRRFTAEGDTKEGAAAPPPRQSTTASSTAANDERPSAKTAAAKPTPTKTEQAKPREKSIESSDSETASSLGADGFSSFLISMATQTLMLLGEIPEPETNQTIVNLEAARQSIDMISILEEKTKGNLTADEAKLMGDMLASLRLAYVKRSREK